MILAIVGSRNFTDYALFVSTIQENFAVETIKEIVSGGARGADTLAEKFARENAIPFTCFRADWDKYGRAAGPMRNTLIAKHCTHFLAFPSKSGRGTQDTIKKATLLGKPGHILCVE